MKKCKAKLSTYNNDKKCKYNGYLGGYCVVHYIKYLYKKKKVKTNGKKNNEQH